MQCLRYLCFPTAKEDKPGKAAQVKPEADAQVDVDLTAEGSADEDQDEEEEKEDALTDSKNNGLQKTGKGAFSGYLHQVSYDVLFIVIVIVTIGG